MNSDVKSAELFQPVSLENLPDGEFSGRWTGYTVIVVINGSQYRFDTTNGIRTINAKCSVSISNGSITIAAT